MAVNAREIVTGQIAMDNVKRKRNYAMENVLKDFFCARMVTFSVEMKDLILFEMEYVNPKKMYAMENVLRDFLTVGTQNVEMKGLNIFAMENVFWFDLVKITSGILILPNTNLFGKLNNFMP